MEVGLCRENGTCYYQDKNLLPFNILRLSILRPPKVRKRRKKPNMRFLRKTDGLYSWPYVAIPRRAMWSREFE